MRWEYKNKSRTNGETKIVKEFAIFPKRMRDGYIVWLESYYAKYRWRAWNDPSLNDEWVLQDSWSFETHNKKIEQSLFSMSDEDE